MYYLLRLFESSKNFVEYKRGYFERLCQLMNNLDEDKLETIVDTIKCKILNGKRIFLAGNGGSSAVLSHWVNDLVVGNYVMTQPKIRAFNLTDNQSVITALGNDEGFENIFVGQLRNLAEGEDLLIVMSVSGNSPNLVKSVEWAKSNGLYTIGIVGCDGGKLKSLCDIVLHIESTKDEYGPVEDIFNVITHLISTYLAQERGRKLYH
ncbi:MAG: SIS domain-containing protein [Candidatus Hydrogenedentes bacterium]|nr:SIS domain-containing protein [Candidatus Hydrogenedentota bacterium]